MPGTQVNFGNDFPFRFVPGALNRARFKTITDFVASESVSMALDSPDPLVTGNRQDAIVIKRIEAGVYLPLGGTPPPPFQPFDCVRALFHEYTFTLYLNGKPFSYPVAFTSNADRVVSDIYWANTIEPVVDLQCSVNRDFIDPANTGSGFNAYLYFLVESFPYMPQQAS